MLLPDLARLRLGEPKAAERARLPARAGRHPALLLRVPGAEKRDPPTAERGAASKAVARERPQAFTAGRRAAKTAGPAAGPTVAELSDLLKSKGTELLWLMSESQDGEQRELQEEVASLERQVDEATAAEARRAKAFCAEAVRGKLQPHMLRLEEEEEINGVIDLLKRESAQHAERISELHQKGPLSPDESHEQLQLRDINRRIREGIDAGLKAAPLRKARREQKERFRKALADRNAPEEHLTSVDILGWWKLQGKRLWEKLRAREAQNALRKSANLAPLGSEDHTEPKEVPPLHWNAPSSPSAYQAAAEQLNERLCALGLGAIAALKQRRDDESKELRKLEEEASKRVLADGSTRGGGGASGTDKKPKTGPYDGAP